jgi:(2Fe-2S) ferredoxin
MAFNMGLMQRGVQPGQVLVSGTGCLGPCEQGPTVAIILDEHIAKGTPAATLNPDAVWK